MAAAASAADPSASPKQNVADVAQHQIAYQSQEMLSESSEPYLSFLQGSRRNFAGLTSTTDLLSQQWLLVRTACVHTCIAAQHVHENDAQVLKDVASTGSAVHPWRSLSHVLRVRMLQVVRSVLIEDEAALQPESQDAVQRSLRTGLADGEARLAYLTALLDDLNEAPFTLQRLCELLLFPRRHFATCFKLMNALQKVLQVSSTVPPVPLHRRLVNAEHWVYAAAAYMPSAAALHPRPVYATSPVQVSRSEDAVAAPVSSAAGSRRQSSVFPRPASALLPVTTMQQALVVSSSSEPVLRIMLGDDDDDVRVPLGATRGSKRPRMDSPPTLQRSDSPNGLMVPAQLEPILSFPSVGSDSSPPFTRMHSSASSMPHPGVSRSPDFSDAANYSDLPPLELTDDFGRARERDALHPPPLASAAATAWDTTVSYSLAPSSSEDAMLPTGLDRMVGRDGDGGWGGEATTRAGGDSISPNVGRTAADAYTAVAEAAAAVLRAAADAGPVASPPKLQTASEQLLKASSLQLLQEYDDD